MALARKTFFSLGGPTYIPDARVQEAQRQQQLDQANAAALRAHQLAQQQLQQQNAQAAWKNHNAAQKLDLDRMRSDFLYGDDARSLRARGAELPWEQLAQRGSEFDRDHALRQDIQGLARDRFEYGKELGESPQEAFERRALEQSILGDRARVSGIMSSEGLTNAKAEALLNKYLSETLQNDPTRTEAGLYRQDQLDDMKLRQAQIRDRYFEGDEALARAGRLEDFSQKETLGALRDLQLAGASDQLDWSRADREKADRQALADAEEARLLSGLLGFPGMSPEGINTYLGALGDQAEIAGRQAGTDYRRAELTAAKNEAGAVAGRSAAAVMSSPEFQEVVESPVDPATVRRNVPIILANTPPQLRGQVLRQLKLAAGFAPSRLDFDPNQSTIDRVAAQFLTQE